MYCTVEGEGGSLWTVSTDLCYVQRFCYEENVEYNMLLHFILKKMNERG